MDHYFLSALILLLLVLDPLGSLPVFIPIMRGVAPERKGPLIFPLAGPLLAGPSAMATVLLLASRQPESMGSWIGALAAAMGVSGHLLTAIAVEMILAGLKRYFLG